jgi:transcriptional regulator with AAA-type ATPase domain
VAESAKRITIPPMTARKDEIPVLLDRWFIDVRSPLRFGLLAHRVQDKLLSYRWRKNLEELRKAAEHLVLLAHYKSEREAERDTAVTRSECRAFRKRLKLPLPLVPETADAGQRRKAKP